MRTIFRLRIEGFPKHFKLPISTTRYQAQIVIRLFFQLMRQVYYPFWTCGRGFFPYCDGTICSYCSNASNNRTEIDSRNMRFSAVAFDEESRFSEQNFGRWVSLRTIAKRNKISAQTSVDTANHNYSFVAVSFNTCSGIGSSLKSANFRCLQSRDYYKFNRIRASRASNSYIPISRQS